ncbi:MAG: hypothetical protein A4S08_02055 [Proteobacteria bacterium SG_bin4]|nr:MAG: hypothetical protein A4S08_02055 [Proteobacteria bacterium SG_bin4]
MVIYISKSKMTGLNLSATEVIKAIGMTFISCQNILISYNMGMGMEIGCLHNQECSTFRYLKQLMCRLGE